MSAVDVLQLVKSTLAAAGLDADYGPRPDLPVSPDGRVGQAVVLYATPLHVHTRTCGGSSGREDRITVVCVGPSMLDALHVSGLVDAALGGLRTSEAGGVLRQTISTSPSPEPNADPVRVSMSLEYSTITKD